MCYSSMLEPRWITTTMTGLDLVAWMIARLEEGEFLGLGGELEVAFRQRGGRLAGQFAVRLGADDVYPRHFKSSFAAAKFALEHIHCAQ